ncbi:hypothetical protein [Ekhidna sp.]|uniref:hypothetical protein n=1 Tax=Ekhidna sp. TaxID=2608089 RepID=UPI0032F08CA1
MKEILREREYISLCKKQIEQKLNFSSEPMERDFEYLHEIILEKTRTDLSTSTLRRIWSDKYQSIPQTKTLDALAQFLGHSRWHAFKNSLPNDKKHLYKLTSRSVLYSLGLLLIVCTIIFLTSTDKAVGEVILEPEVEMHEGVPATIGFNYLVPNPEVEIELSWNPYERVVLDMENNFYTGTYYYPDYHKAKLLYQDQVLAQQAVHVTTQGWHALLMDSGMDIRPQYVDKSDFLYSSGLWITRETVEKLAEDATELYPVFTLSNTSLEVLSGDDFSLLAEIAMAPISESTLCLMYEVLIKGSYGSMRIPITQKGCYGIATLVCAEKSFSGKFNDLSDLTTDVTMNHNVKITSRDKKLHLQVDGNQTYELDFEGTIGQLKVIKFIFNGLPEISEFKLMDSNNEQLDVGALYPFNE